MYGKTRFPLPDTTSAHLPLRHRREQRGVQPLRPSPSEQGAPRPVLTREAVVPNRLQAMQMIRHQPKEGRRVGAYGLAGAARHRGSGLTVLAADGVFSEARGGRAGTCAPVLGRDWGRYSAHRD